MSEASPEGTHLEPPTSGVFVELHGVDWLWPHCGQKLNVALAPRAPAPLFTPEDAALIRSLADCLKIFAPAPELDKLRVIAEKMSAPSEKP